MKKIIMFLTCVLFLFGCGKINENDLIDKLSKKVEKAQNYQLVANLKIFRNEDSFEYDVVSTYKKEGYFKVELTNKLNNHNQIILKDEESVYVLTPALNKSFKFQSEWPYNNSQIYLLQPMIIDAKEDKDKKIEKKDDGYVVISNVNYTNEPDFKKQKLYFDKDSELVKVEVTDGNDSVKMCLEIISTQFDIKLDEDFFDVNRYQKSDESNDEKNESAGVDLDEVVYPMYVPQDTYLSVQDIVSTDFGERVILTFSGASNFTLVQENMNTEEQSSYVYGDPYLILDTVGMITDYSVSWISNGVEYSILSDTMPVSELITVAQSISVEAVGK